MARGDGIKPIGSLFEKYARALKPPQTHVITTFCDVVADVVGITLDSAEIAYSTHTKIITVRTASPVKTEILLKKQILLTHLKGRLGVGNAPRDIL